MPHTVNIFPALLDFSLLAPLILRVVVGLIFVDLGYLKIRREKSRWLALYKTFLFGGRALLIGIAAIEIVGGALLIVGLYTQLAALILSLFAFANLYLEYKDNSFVKRTLPFYIMLLAITLSLIITGAGFFAIDWPL